MSTSYEHNPNKAVFEMPIGVTVVERCYAPQQSANNATFKQDAAYFKTRKDRWITVRKAMPAECDNMEATFWLDGAIVSPPTAWMRVTRHPKLGFRAVIVWRGSLVGIPVDDQGYLALESDDAVDLILQNMTSQGCANWPEVVSYSAKLERAKAIHSAQHPTVNGPQKVH